MKRKRFREEQIIGVLRQAEAGAKTADLCRQVGIREQTFYRWKARYGGLKVSEAKRLRGLETENRKLKQLLGEAQLDKAALKELLAKNWQGPRNDVTLPVTWCSGEDGVSVGPANWWGFLAR